MGTQEMTDFLQSENKKAAEEPMVSIPLSTLKWWRQLVDSNPQDLAPRMDAYIRKAQPSSSE
jgi:hypothetical protein